ncbi:MAG TPA: class I SAM-dependent methyltransferase [Terracidiphilus sp.]|nr:class I SAM-dependent methyltransferase [Terracidiphilus sp.]
MLRQIARRILPPAVRALPHKVCGAVTDCFYGIRTEGWYSLSAADRSLSAIGDGSMYQSCPYHILWNAMRRLPARVDGTFYDLGCGKGRAVCVAARSGKFLKCAGVELVPDLAEKARRNLAKTRCSAPSEIVTADALTVDFSDGAVFFFHNPFGLQTLTRVLDNIRNARKQKETYIVVYGPANRAVYESLPWLRKVWASTRWGIWKGVP